MGSFLKRWKTIPVPVLLGVVGLAALVVYGSLYKNPAGRITGSNMNEQEARLACLLSGIEGIGQVEVLITKEQGQSFSDQNEGAARGVIVCAEGTEDFEAYIRVQRAVATALDVAADQIEIYPMKEKGES